MTTQDWKSLTASFDERLDRFVRSAFLSGFFCSNIPTFDPWPSTDFELLAAPWVEGDGTLGASEVSRRRELVAVERRRLETQDREKLARYSRSYDRGTIACFALLAMLGAVSVALTVRPDLVGDIPLSAGGLQVAMFALVAVRLSHLFLGQPGTMPTMTSKDIVFPESPEIVRGTEKGSPENDRDNGRVLDDAEAGKGSDRMIAARERLRDVQDHLSVAMASKDEREVRHSVVMAAGGVDLAMTLTAPTFARQLVDRSGDRR